MIDPRGPDGVGCHLFDVHIGTRHVGEHRDNPRGVVDCQHVTYRVVVIITIEFLNQGRAVVQDKLARPVSVEKHLVAVTLTHFILQSVPFFGAIAVGAATDVLLTAPVPHEGTLGIFFLFTA